MSVTDLHLFPTVFQPWLAENSGFDVAIKRSLAGIVQELHVRAALCMRSITNLKYWLTIETRLLTSATYCCSSIPSICTLKASKLVRVSVSSVTVALTWGRSASSSTSRCWRSFKRLTWPQSKFQRMNRLTVEFCRVSTHWSHPDDLIEEKNKISCCKQFSNQMDWLYKCNK